jgi:hypothetical protein
MEVRALDLAEARIMKMADGGFRQGCSTLLNRLM